MNTSTLRVDGLLFDKDGTLFDFRATWNVWSAQLIRDFAAGDSALAAAIARSVGFDLVAESFLPDSPIIAGTNRQAAELFAAPIPGSDADAMEAILAEAAADAPLAPAVPLVPFLEDLLTRGLTLGVMTNDTEFSAKSQLRRAGVDDRFHWIAGFDSGHGAKPQPHPLLAFANAHGLQPGRVAMVGDSTHDLIAGREAGMQTIAVLTGMAGAEELRPYADVIFRDIGHIAGWLHS